MIDARSFITGNIDFFIFSSSNRFLFFIFFFHLGQRKIRYELLNNAISIVGGKKREKEKTVVQFVLVSRGKNRSRVYSERGHFSTKLESLSFRTSCRTLLRELFCSGGKKEKLMRV